MAGAGTGTVAVEEGGGALVVLVALAALTAFVGVFVDLGVFAELGMVETTLGEEGGGGEEKIYPCMRRCATIVQSEGSLWLSFFTGRRHTAVV